MSQKMTAIHVRVPADLKERLDQIARSERRTIGATVQIALEQYLKEKAKTADESDGE